VVEEALQASPEIRSVLTFKHKPVDSLLDQIGGAAAI
jgi:hypothetical protein